MTTLPDPGQLSQAGKRRQNALKNGLLPIVGDAKTHAFSKTCILEGLDEIGSILKHESAIVSLENRR